MQGEVFEQTNGDLSGGESPDVTEPLCASPPLVAPENDFIKSSAELTALLQTRFLPALQTIATSVKKIVGPADIPNHVGEVQTIVSILKLLSEIQCPSSVKAPSFDNVAEFYAPNTELVQFMVNAHKSIWEVTAKVAGLIRLLQRASDAHKVEKARLDHYWRLYRKLIDLAAQQTANNNTNVQ